MFVKLSGDVGRFTLSRHAPAGDNHGRHGNTRKGQVWSAGFGARRDAPFSEHHPIPAFAVFPWFPWL